MNSNTVKLLCYLSDFTILLPVVVLLIRWRCLKNLMNYIVAYVAVLAVRNAIAIFIGEYFDYKLNNIFYYNLANAITFYVVIALNYWLVFNVAYRKLFKFFGVVFSVCCVMDVFNGSLSDLHTGRWGVFTYPASVILIILTLLFYFYDFIKGMRVFQITTYPFFWFNAGALLFYSGSSIIHILTSETLNQPPDVALNYWLLEAVLAIFFNCMIAVSLLYCKNADLVKVKY